MVGKALRVLFILILVGVTIMRYSLKDWSAKPPVQELIKWVRTIVLLSGCGIPKVIIYRLPQIIALTRIWSVNKNIKRTSTVDLAYEVVGPNPTQGGRNVFAFHGLLGSKRNWRTPSRLIAEGTNASVITGDLRNHGGSPHTSSHKYGEMAADVARLLAKFSLNSAHFIGHSMGGKTLMALALEEPAKVSSLIVADVSPIPNPMDMHNNLFPQLVDVLLSVNFEGSKDSIEAKKIAVKTILASGMIKEERLGFILMNIGQLSDKSYGWVCNLQALKDNFRYIASFPLELANKQYSGPTLFIGGGLSSDIPKEDFPQIKKYFPNAALKYIDHVGHNVHFEDVRLFAAIVNEFLNEHL